MVATRHCSLVYDSSFGSALVPLQHPMNPLTIDQFASRLDSRVLAASVVVRKLELSSHLGEIFAGLKPLSRLHGSFACSSLEIYVVIK